LAGLVLERVELERVLMERILVERLVVERLVVERLELERIVVERLELERIVVERFELERFQLERFIVERIVVERFQLERLVVERLILERILLERIFLELIPTIGVSPWAITVPTVVVHGFAPSARRTQFGIVAPVRRTSAWRLTASTATIVNELVYLRSTPAARPVTTTGLSRLHDRACSCGRPDGVEALQPCVARIGLQQRR
jgi:hypothetical protein